MQNSQEKKQEVTISRGREPIDEEAAPRKGIEHIVFRLVLTSV